MQISKQIFYIHSGNLVAFAESEILKFIRLDNIIKATQFINIQSEICWINGYKKEKFLIIKFSIVFKVSIQLACNAIYGPIIKLMTVIGIRITKYNFSVVIVVLKDIWILQQQCINQIIQANSNKTKVSWPADKKLAYFQKDIHMNVEWGCDINHITHCWIQLPKAKHVIPAI